MNEFALRSLLRRGTKTWHGGDYDTTIDLVLASADLADTTVKCAIHGTEHGSDHRAIETVFDTLVPVPKQQDRLLLKNAPWKEINTRIASGTGRHPLWGHRTAADGSTDVGGPGGSPSPDTESETLAIRQAVVDNRPHTIASYLHILEEPRPDRTTSGSNLMRLGGNGEKGLQSSTTTLSGNRRRSTGTSFSQTTAISGRLPST